MTTPLLIQAESRAVPLADKSVHCIVTSPPYFALRDYGTGAWQGGESGCDHSPASTPQRRGLASSTLGGGKGTTGHQREGYGHTCGHCGATRIDQQLGLEPLHDCSGWATGVSCGACYICAMRAVARECWRVLRNDGTFWCNVGDSYNAAGREGHGTRIGYKQGTNRASATGQDTNRATAPGLKPKDLCGIPWRLALALQADGWTLRSEIIWHKPNPMPESVMDRPTRSHEQVFLLSKQGHYFYDAVAIQEKCAPLAGGNTSLSYSVAGEGTILGRTTLPHGGLAGRNKQGDGTRNARTVWTIATEPTPHSHFATYPAELVRRCVLAGTPAHGVVFDPFCGSGTTLHVARELGRASIGTDLSYPYLHDIARQRLGFAALDAWGGKAPAPRASSYADLPLFAGS